MEFIVCAFCFVMPQLTERSRGKRPPCSAEGTMEVTIKFVDIAIRVLTVLIATT